MSAPKFARPTHARFVVMGFLCALSFLTYYDRVCIVRAQEDIQRDLHFGPAQMGWVFGVFWLAYGLFELPGGWLGDRFGARGILTRCVVAWSVCTLLTGSAGGLVSLLLVRFLFGMGEAGAYPNMARIQSRWLPERSRGRAGGLLWLMARWGAAFSPVLFGALLRLAHAPAFHSAMARLHLPAAIASAPAWRIGFWASGLVGFAWIALFFPWFRDDPADSRSVNRAELDLIRSSSLATPKAGRRPERRPPVARIAWALASSANLWLLAGLYLAGSFGYSFFVSWMPRYFKEVRGLSFEKSEWMNAAPPFCAGIACLVGGWLSDVLVRATGRKRLARAVLPIAGYVTAAGAMFAIRYVHDGLSAAELLCVAAAAYDFGQGANWATILDVGGLYAGAAAGLVNMVGNLGNFLQPPIGAAIQSHLGWNALFAAYAGAFLLAASAWFFINPNRPFYEHGRET